METSKPTITISQIFQEFLADQKGRISQKTYAKYSTVIQLYGSYLEMYWPGHDDEASAITTAGGTYCGTFGCEEVTDGYSEFLGYFMPRKVMCGKETMQAAGTVTKRLAKWLTEKGYANDTQAAQQRADEATKALPNAEKVLAILDAWLESNCPRSQQDEIEDHFWIERIEPGKLWLRPQTETSDVLGPVPAPELATDLCRPMWDIGGAVVKVGKTWRLADVWSVTP